MHNTSGTIIYFGGFEMPDRNAAAHRVMNNAKIFDSLGYDVVFCGIDKEIGMTDTKKDVFNSFQSIPKAYPQNSREWFCSLLSIQNEKDVIESFDNVKFVVAYNMHAYPLKKLTNYCKKNGIKIIADVTEWYGNSFSFRPDRFIRWIDTELVMKYFQKKVDGIIAISSLLTNYYSKFVKNIVQIPPLVDSKEEIWSEEQQNISNIVEFVYTGVPGNDKDKIDSIIEAFSNISGEFLFTVIGITKEQYLTEHPARKALLISMENKIRFLGRVSHRDSVAFLMKADYCIFIRDYTLKNNAGFPTKFAECVTAGIGVVANRISNLEDYFPMHDSILLDSIETHEIQVAIKNSIRNGKVAHKKSELFDYRHYIPMMNKFLCMVSDFESITD